MQKTSSLHSMVFHSLDEQIAVIDRTGTIVDVNKAWQSFGENNGLPPEYSCIGQNYLKTMSESGASGDEHAEKAAAGIRDVLEGRCLVFYYEYPCDSPEEKHWFTMRICPLHGDDSGNRFVISHHNITQRKLAEEQIEKLAMQDPLTGLANRRAMQEFMNREIRINARNKTPICLIFVDVDYFKNYNDKFGHAAGDRCLVNIGQVLQSCARRGNDIAARFGGDEFALILGNTELDEARKIADSILKEIDGFDMYFDKSRKVTVSIGLVYVIPGEQESEDFLFREADKALYRAKQAGRNQVVYAQQSDDHQ